ncbi:hypothetical protein PG984_011241 [Apiospora sp. TS-2023a]
MMWQNVAFLLGFVPNIALAAKASHLPALPRQMPGISISDSPTEAGGWVLLPQHSSDGGPAFTMLEATLTVPNLTFASGQSSAGAPYQMGLGCGIYATTDGNTQAACNRRGPHIGLNGNLTSDGLTTPSGWTNWPPLYPSAFSSDQATQLNLTTGDDVMIQINLTNASYASYTIMNLKDTTKPVTLTNSVADEPMCSGDGTTAYAGCYLGALDVSKLPGFVEQDFEAITVYDRSNQTHEFGLESQVQFHRLVYGGKVLAMPQIEEEYDFSVQWSENPDYGSGIAGEGSTTSGYPPATSALRW